MALTCPLTPETENLIDAARWRAMRPTAHLINVARGRIVDEAALDCGADARAHRRRRPRRDARGAAAGRLAAVGDAQRAADAPHGAGETQRYEDAVIDILLENLDRLWRGESGLRNQIV